MSYHNNCNNSKSHSLIFLQWYFLRKQRKIKQCLVDENHYFYCILRGIMSTFLICWLFGSFLNGIRKFWPIIQNKILTLLLVIECIFVAIGRHPLTLSIPKSLTQLTNSQTLPWHVDEQTRITFDHVYK